MESWYHRFGHHSRGRSRCQSNLIDRRIASPCGRAMNWCSILSLRRRWSTAPSFLRRAILVGIVVFLLYAILLRTRRTFPVVNRRQGQDGRPLASFIIRPTSTSPRPRDLPESDLPSERINQSSHSSFPAGSSAIPKVIHQTWKSREDIPETVRPWMESWVRLNADWEYWFWTDDDMRSFIAEIFPEYLSLYDGYENQYYRADAFRYFVLFAYGGLYADLDMECLRPLASHLDTDDCVISQEPLEHAHFLSHLGPILASNALMACRPQHPFFAYVISGLDSSYRGYFRNVDILHATGPFMLTKAYLDYYHEEGVLPFSAHAPVEHKVRLGNPDEFQPNPDNSMVDEMRRRCKLYERDDVGARSKKHANGPKPGELCNKLMSYDFGRKVNPSAYTDHHWIHTWAGKLHDPWGLSNMRRRFSVTDLLRIQRSQ